MKKNVLITLGAAACLLVSCNKNMPSITNDRAKQLAQEILTRQGDEQLFTDPNNFICKSISKINQESLSQGGKSQSNYLREETFMIDVANLRYRRIIKDTTGGTSSSLSNEYDEITFYDVRDAKLYTLMNENGYKHRQEESNVTEEEARGDIISARNGFENTYKWHTESYQQHPFALDQFDSELESVVSTHEKLKDETDQYCNYYLGSSNAKSLQVKVDSKTKLPPYVDEYEGYSTDHFELKLKNDLLESSTYDFNSNSTWKIDKRFYQKQNGSQTITMSYGNASIGIPNINDYPLTDK